MILLCNEADDEVVVESGGSKGPKNSVVAEEAEDPCLALVIHGAVGFI